VAVTVNVVYIQYRKRLHQLALFVPVVAVTVNVVSILYVHYVNSQGHDGPLKNQLMKSSPITI
jgi:hypothetical protein